MEQQNQQPVQEKTELKPPIKTNEKIFAIVAIVAIILVIGGILLLREFQQEIPKQTLPPPAPSPQSQQFIPGQEVTIQGLVVENSLGCINDQGHKLCISDGPLHFLIRDNRNREIKVVYHYGEWPRCLNNEVALQAKQLKESDEVDVFAKVVSENEVSTCDSQAYYIKQLGPDSNTDTSTWQTYRNDEFGFEFEYPEAFAGDEFCSPMEREKNVINLGTRMWIAVENSNGIDLKEYLKEVFALTHDFDPAQILIEENISIGGQKGIRVTDRRGLFEGAQEMYVVNNGKVYTLQFIGGSDCALMEEIEKAGISEFSIFQHILSTFRFAE